MPPKTSGRDVELRQLMDTLLKIETNVGKVERDEKKKVEKETIHKFTAAKQIFMRKLDETCDLMETEVGASDPKAVIARNQVRVG